MPLRALVLLLLLVCSIARAQPQVEAFSPQGEVKGVRQVQVRFATPMVPFGDPRLVEPFEITCPAKGSGRWADPRNWVFDFERDLPAGMLCQFVVKPGLTDLEGAPVGAGRFAFTTGGPAVRESMPWEGHEAIDENQVFILGLDALATEASIARNAWCDIGGRADRVPVRLVGGAERKAILDRRRDFLSRFEQFLVAGSDMEKFFRARDYDKVPIVLLACRAKLPYEAEVRLVWGRGIATPEGVETSADQVLAFKVRANFSAKFGCERTNAKGQCIPVLPMNLDFTAPVAVAMAEKIVLTGPGGEVFKPKLNELDRKSGFVDRVSFGPTYLEAATFKLSLPAGLADDSGRVLANAKRFPLTVKTDPAPPLAKFAARFGILEANAEPALPITLRNVEKELAGKQATLAGEGGKGVPARLLRVQSPRDVVRWLKRLDDSEARWTEGGYESPSVFTAADATTPMTLPRPAEEKAFEVVGIPLPKPGFYVVEVVSPRLGQALLKDGKPYHVAAAALVTNLAAHFKWGRENSLVWVTTLDRGEPAPGADVAVLDCNGRVYFEGKTNASGIARVNSTLPRSDALPGCKDQWDKKLFVTARLGADATFTFSDWNEGIASWRFHLRHGGGSDPESAATVFDRTLLRAGDTVGMKHFWRRRTGSGFALPAPNAFPVRAVIQHEGSGQRWELPLAWDNGIAESAWAVPKDAKLGNYTVTLAGPRKKKDEPYVEGRQSGSFRVEEFRVPMLRATVQLPAAPQIRPAAVDVGVQLTYLAGGAAGGQKVKLRSLVSPRAVSFPQHDGVRFANGDVKEGRAIDSESEVGEFQPEGEDEAAERPRFGGSRSDQVRPLRTRALTLDAGGAARATLDDLPPADAPRDLLVEAEYADPNGQVLTRSSRVPLWPSGVLLGVQPDGWALSKDKVKAKVIAVDPSGKPAADVAVRVDLFQREAFSHRKRLIGGFYAYESGQEIRRVGEFCAGRTDAMGLLFCEAPVAQSGNVILRARAADAAGNAAVANADAWIAGSDDWWFEQGNDDRMDVLPERPRYEPGETAVLQVRSPFRQATALVTVEREGVLDAFVTPLSGKAPVVKVPIKGNHAPNAFVSVFAVRGRVADVPPTALVDLGKPAYRMGLADIDVGWKAHRLDVKVKPSREVWKVREKVPVTVEVRRADGTKPPKGSEVAIAAVDEALLELMPNDSWQLLEAMMQPRGLEVETATAAMQVIGRRHYGRKAMAPGGGGGRQSTRELFDTLLLWKARVKLDGEGRAQVEVPLVDSLSSYRIVAIASGGVNFFGTGTATVRTTQALQLSSGLPPLVRERDRFAATFTVRNAGDAPLEVVVQAEAAGTAGKRAPLEGLAPQRVKLAPGAATPVTWNVVAPVAAGGLQWLVTARADGASEAESPSDRVKVSQQVVPAVPVRTLQATLAQVDGTFALPVAMPADAVPGRGGITVQLRDRLAGDLDGVKEYMGAYPYTCLEQRVSKAVALHDDAAWRTLAAGLPAWLDADGLAKYFPRLSEGSDVLTAYVLAVAHEAGREIPEPALTRMVGGLRAFVEGRVVRHSALPTADLAIRKVAALEALSRHVTDLDPALLGSVSVEPNLWPTSAVIDWFNLARRWQALPDREARLAQAEQILRSRLNFQGTVMGFSTERSDFLWWLMVSGDVNANRALLALMEEPRWREDVPRLMRGALSRQHAGRWNTTVANAWGVLAVEKFGQRFEAAPVTGATSADLGEMHRKLDWSAAPHGDALQLDWPAKAAELKLQHAGTGKPWVTVQSRAAIPLAAPLSSGYRITRTVTGVEGAGGGLRRGDVVRVRLAIDAQTDMTWVVVNDPIPAGATILGTGLGGDSPQLAAGEQRTGWVRPAFEERAFDGFRAYYALVPKGQWSVEYTLRLNTPGSFEMPPTRVEAMYSPELFGEVPNARVVVAE